MAIQVVGRLINGTSGYDNIVGNEWSDTYRMTVNYGVTDLVDGGKGTDTLSYEHASQSVFVSLLDGVLFIGDSDALDDTFVNFENLRGSNTDVFPGDSLGGNNDANVIEGLKGEDFLVGAGGNDLLDGGEGGDEVQYSTSTSAVTVSLKDGTATDGIEINDVVGIDTFGESAPAGVLFKHFGFTPENVAATVKAVLKKK